MDAAPAGTGFFIAAACGCRCVPASGGCLILWRPRTERNRSPRAERHEKRAVAK